MKKIAIFAIVFGLFACNKAPESDALKYADAPAAQVPAAASEDFSEFKKKEGCSTEEEIKKKNAEMAAKGQAASLQGAKDSDCNVK